jgi:hypothetical protein
MSQVRYSLGIMSLGLDLGILVTSARTGLSLLLLREAGRGCVRR